MCERRTLAVRDSFVLQSTSPERTRPGREFKTHFLWPSLLCHLSVLSLFSITFKTFDLTSWKLVHLYVLLTVACRGFQYRRDYCLLFPDISSFLYHLLFFFPSTPFSSFPSFPNFHHSPLYPCNSSCGWGAMDTGCGWSQAENVFWCILGTKDAFSNNNSD